MNRLEKQYKAKDPCETVEKIKGILKSNNISVHEEWIPFNSVGTYSLRLYTENTQLGVNGKGTSENYARASAYAELMERIQNMHLARIFLHQNDMNDKSFYIDKKEKKSVHL